ncbi:DUF952 domain-containing protein [Salininema proteolyticum]|uniref:DUF952 domain-containing protein n=1 Tax=Salininema proteolyticum TaxID=1607685 RepID=A0ABV8U1G1_9ACTN
MIFHITSPEIWSRAREEGEYRQSTKNATLDAVGFIHCSSAHQIDAVANCVHADDDGLMVLGIDEARVKAEVVFEVPDDEDETEAYPHVYGPLNVDAVVSLHPLERDESGRFRFDPDRTL